MIKNIIKKLLGETTPMSFKESMDFFNLPVVTFYQNDKKFNFLLDTGSNDCIIDSNILKEIEHEKIDEKVKLSGLEGINHTVNLCKITMSYKNTDYPFVYLIQDLSEVFGSIKEETGLTLHGLLGSKFFNKYNYVLDFADLIAYTK